MRRRDFLATAAAAGLAAQARAEGPAALANRGRFSVEIAGAGPDVILVPGLDCSRDVWGGVADTLKASYRLHLVQVAGFGGEPVRDNAAGGVCAGVAEALADYVHTARLQAPALIGHSMGGTIGLMLAARHPAALGRLMVVDMLPDIAMVMLKPGSTPDDLQTTANAVGDGMAHATPEQFHKQLERRIASMVLKETARPDLVRQGMASDPGVTGRSMRELLLTNLMPELPKITIPTTVVYAWDKSAPYPQSQADALYHQVYAPLRGVKLVRIDDSAHFVFIDQPERFAAAVSTFLA